MTNHVTKSVQTVVEITGSAHIIGLAMEHILVVDDEESMLEFMEYVLEKEGYRVTGLGEGQKALEVIRRNHGFDLVIADLRMPDLDGLDLLRAAQKADPETPFVFVTAYASSDTAIEALKCGAFDYISKPFNVEEFKNLVKNALLARSLKRKVQILESERIQSYQLVGISPPMLEIYKLIGTISATDSTILISGASGTGKELVARAVHQASPRANRPFVSINCGAFPETLLESELFGYMRGAFTGAVNNKKGLFEVAGGGTLFLDEVGEMSPTMQVKLLRVLQEKALRRVGGTEEIETDVRVIAATNRKLEQEIAQGGFREDLYYRLAVIPIHIPGLRERKSDILTLVRHFVQKYNQRLGRDIQGISDEALNCLEKYDWPGNVRELENVIERAMTLESSDFIQKERLPENVRSGRNSSLSGDELTLPRLNPEGLDLDAFLTKVERQLIERALELSEGNQTRAAELLKLSYRSLRHRLEKLGMK